MDDVLIELPKAELHVHIEGTLEPALMFEMARRNGIAIPYADEEAVRRAYAFEDLQSFLDIYSAACNVLVHDRDFYELDERLVNRLMEEQVPLTVCPFSNVKLRVVPDLRKHNFAQMLRQGLSVSINSDDPAYFGGYVGANYVGTVQALDLSGDEALQVARNSFSASFLPEAEKRRHLQAVDDYAAKLADS